MNSLRTFLSEDDIEEISRHPDPVIRNLKITHCYHELSVAMRDLTGGPANWCTFATWASKQAGQSIRGEDLSSAFERQFRNSAEIRGVVRSLMKLASNQALPADIESVLNRIISIIRPGEIFDSISKAVGNGNLKVFREIGRLFAIYLAMNRKGTGPDTDPSDDFNTLLKPGDPPDGQDLLRDAFETYHKARLTVDAKTREELMFKANLLVGYHEQMRLQPEIAGALNAPFRNHSYLKDRFLELVLPGYWLRIRHKLARLLRRDLPLDRLIDRLTDQVQSLARQVTTEFLMTLQLAEGKHLRLGRDLQGSFPEALKVITNPELKLLLNRIDKTPDSLLQSGAADWADFDERMHFITDFFRMYHSDHALFQPPFDHQQTMDIKKGSLPKGRL
jgi:hypothetical protein